jgi:tRNA(Glu) U13 pseudouridine synthase TruD
MDRVQKTSNPTLTRLQSQKYIFNQTVDKPIQTGYISKAVKGDSKTQTTKVAARANPDALNLDNYIV